jgi:integrase
LQGREISRWERIDLLEKHLSVFRNSKDIMVEEIDPEFLRSFRQYLIGLEHNDWKARSIVATMREVYQSAVEVDDTLRVEADPFEGLEMECDFLEYIRDRMKRLLESGQFRTFGRHQSLVKHLEDFLRFIDQDELSFDGITARFLRQFENHLSKVPLKVNSRHTYLKTLRTCLYEAIQDGLFPQELNPFFKFKLKKEKVRKPKLNLEQISQIEALELKPNTGLWNTKNAFLFMFYCAGMRVGDLIQLRWMHVHKDRLRYMMEKTKKAHGPKLIEPAMKILELYRNPLSLPADFIFPLLQNDVDYSDVVFLKKQVSSKTSKLNEHLKTIGGIIGLDFPLTNHIARHSFTRTVQSQDAKEMGIGVHDIQGALAHSSVSITENYLEELDDDALDHVMDGFQEILRRRAIKESDE